jgi:serine/threonine protein phosphatase PrpC
MTDSAAIADPMPTRSLRVHAVVKSDTGLVRTENQDFALATTAEEETSDSGTLLIVADGMGGHRGGAAASRLAGTTIRQEYLASSHDDIPGALRSAFQSANARIHAESVDNIELRGMGTTCSAIVVRDGVAYGAHVGDSRIYLYRGGSIRQLTEDHSLVATMVKEGLLTTREAEVHPRRNVLQRSMGVIESLEVDLLQSFAVEPGDVFVLCSDGLHGLVREGEIGEVVGSQPVDRAVQELVRRALERGAPDNVSVIVARIEEGAPVVAGTGAPEEVETAKIPVAGEGSSATRWFFLLVILLGGAAIVLYLLGYRFDPSALRRLLPQ